MFAAANGWLRSSTDVPKYRYNFSLSTLLSSSGFVRGPMRQLYTEVDARAVPFFGGYHNVVIVHTRHPVEMMVSAYFCISDPKVCPVRAKFLGSHVPVNDSVASLDEFLLRGVGLLRVRVRNPNPNPNPNPSPSPSPNLATTAALAEPHRLALPDASPAPSDASRGDGTAAAAARRAAPRTSCSA